MSLSRNDLIKAVALRMDEITPDNPVIVSVDGSDNNPLYGLIDGLINDCTLELFSIAPYWRLPQTPFVYDDGDADKNEIALGGVFQDTAYERKIVRLKVNDKFLRVAEINSGYWARPITEVFPEQSPEGHRQHSPYLFGKNAKPVGIMSHGMWASEGGVDVPCREIDCYSLDSEIDDVEGASLDASYIAAPEAIGSTGHTTVESVVPPVLIPALEWLIAARTFGARGDANHAAICQQNAQNLLV